MCHAHVCRVRGRTVLDVYTTLLNLMRMFGKRWLAQVSFCFFVGFDRTHMRLVKKYFPQSVLYQYGAM